MAVDLWSIPEHLGYYLAGFVDGEGSFHVVFRPRQDYRIPWKVSLCFNISQKDCTVLNECKQTLGCGTIRQRADGVWYYEVNDIYAIRDNVIPFFERFEFRSVKKQRDFSKFKEIASVLLQERHLSEEGIREILGIRESMNDGGKRKYTDRLILDRFIS